MAGDHLGPGGPPPGGATGAVPPGAARDRATTGLSGAGRFPWLVLGAFTVATAEILAFAGAVQLIGFLYAVLLVVGFSLVGVLLLRREGLRAWRGFREAATSGVPPGVRVTDGLVGLGGALLLVVPGLVTGAVGLVVLAPPGRGLVRRWAQSRIERRVTSAQAGEMFGPRRVRVQPGTPEADDGDAEVLEGEVIDPGGRPA